MLENLTISKTSPAFPEYVDFHFLREAGIKYLQTYAGEIWTDYNLHDPGITILEVLSYAITDLGHRLSYETKDLLALNPEDSKAKENNFFTADQILTINPVTELDFRKRLIDIPGVRNAWLQKVTELEDPRVYIDCKLSRFSYEKPTETAEGQEILLHLKGIYDVCLQLDPQMETNACGEVYETTESIIEEVRKLLCLYRNLCEDFRDILVLEEEEIALCSDIELTNEADPEDVLVEIFVKVQEFLSPRIRFYSLPELLQKRKSPAEIYAGRPSVNLFEDSQYESHGFIDTEELAAIELRDRLHSSDLYQLIMDVPGVAAVKKLSILNYINGLAQSLGDSWCLHLTEKHHPVVSVDFSKITFFKGDLPFKADSQEVNKRFKEQQSAYIKTPLASSDLDLAVPAGVYFKLADHYSIHHDFPITYGIGDEGLPGHVPPIRHAQAKQLKAFLLFFDQILANYLSQLAHVRDLFSMEQVASEDSNRHTYFSQGLENVPCAAEIIRNYNLCEASDLLGEVPTDYIPYLQSITENESLYTERRNRFLNHLLARFSENFTDYVLLNHQINPLQGKSVRRSETDIIQDKSNFLSEYPLLSHDRFRAYNYCGCEEVWDTNNVSGFKKRVSRLMGIKDFSRRNLHHCEIVHDQGGYRYSLHCEDSLSPLVSKTIFSSIAEAQEAFTHFSSFVTDADHYISLSHSFFYQYSWEITDASGNAISEFSYGYASQEERNEELAKWREIWEENPIPDKASSILIPPTQDSNIPSYTFQLQFSNPNIPERQYLYVSSQEFSTIGQAEIAAGFAFEQLFSDSNYLRRSQKRQSDEAESSEGSLEMLSYFGFAVVDQEGKIIAESKELFAEERERDEQLQKFIACVLTNGKSIEVQAARECFFIEIFSKDGSQLLLRAEEGCPSEAIANRIYEQSLQALQEEENYELIIAADGSFGFKAESPMGNTVFIHPRSYETERERDLQLQALLYYLNQINPCAKISGQEGTFQVSLLDTEGNILFSSYHTYSTHKLAENAYQKILHLAASDIYYSPLDALEGENPYGFELVDRHNNVFASHPGSYPTACERDIAIEAIINFINKEIQKDIYQDNGKYRYALLNQNDKQLLISEALFPDGIAADNAFDEMLPLAEVLANYELTTDESNACPYGFRLTDGTNTVLATHPDTYELESERDLALQALINCLLMDDPPKQIDGTDGQYSYFLLDVLFDEENVLLSSKLSYPDKDIAASAWKASIDKGRFRDNYVSTGSAGSWGFELWDEPVEGECIASHTTEDGTPITYTSEAEREAAIDKIICYLYREHLDQAYLQLKASPSSSAGEDIQWLSCISIPDPIQYLVVNEEGAYVGLVLDQSNEILFEGVEVLNSEAEAIEQAEQIGVFAQEAEAYQIINKGIAECSFGIFLYEGERLLASHPQVYASEEAAQRQINLLILLFSSAESLFRIRETFTQFPFLLLNPSGDTLLMGKAYKSEAAAGDASQEIWTLGADLENYVPVEENGTYSFQIMKGEEVFASHSSSYGSEEERDLARDTVLGFIQTLGIPYLTKESEEKFQYKILGPDSHIFLESKGRYDMESEATEALKSVINQMIREDSYRIAFDQEACEYEIQLMGEAGEVLAFHSPGYATEQLAEEKLQGWISYLSQFPKGVSIQSNNPTYHFEMLDLEGELILESCGSYESSNAAEQAFRDNMEILQNWDNILRLYDNELCTFSFEFIDPLRGSCFAKSPKLFLSPLEREERLAVIQFATQEFTPRNSALGTACAYYLVLDLPEHQIVLKSTEKYPTETRAWQAVEEFVYQLVHEDRYLSPATDDQGNLFALAIIDQEEKWIAQSIEQNENLLKGEEVDVDQIFIDLNTYDVSVFIELNEGSRLSPTVLLKDFKQKVLLQTDQVFADLEAVQRFLDEKILQVLYKEEAYHILPATSGTGYTFELHTLPEEGSISEKLAEHPHIYSTEDEVLEALQVVQQFAGIQNINFMIDQVIPAYVNQLIDQKGNVVLSGSNRLDYGCLLLAQTTNDEDSDSSDPIADGAETSYAQAKLYPNWSYSQPEIEEIRRALSENILSVNLYPRIDTHPAHSQEGVMSTGIDFRGRELFQYGIELIIELEELGETSLFFLSADSFLDRNEALAEADKMISLLESTSSLNCLVLFRQTAEQEYSLIYLDEEKRITAKEMAWQSCNSISELAQDPNNYRLINDDSSNCTYDFVLTNEGKDIIMAANEEVYSTRASRDEAIDEVIKSVNDEGFHVLEHILLRPRQKGIPNTYFWEWKGDKQVSFELCSSSASPSLASAITSYTELINAIERLPVLDPEETSALVKYQAYLSSLLSFYDSAGNLIEFPIVGNSGPDPVELPEVEGCIFAKISIAYQDQQGNTLCPIFEWKEAFEQWETTEEEEFRGAIDVLYDWVLWLQTLYRESSDIFEERETSCFELRAYPTAFETEQWMRTTDHFFEQGGGENLRSLFEEFFSDLENVYVEEAELKPEDTRFRIQDDASSGEIVIEYLDSTKEHILLSSTQIYTSTVDAIETLIGWKELYAKEETLIDFFPCGWTLNANRKENDPALEADGFLPIETSPEDCADINSKACVKASLDPYSFWISVILPYWPERFRDMNFRRFVEQSLRLEAPAHVGLKICWIDVCQMHDFEILYQAWLKNLASESCSHTPCERTRSLNDLLEFLPKLNNVYPEATLHDCEESGPEDNPIILNQTALGTANE